MDVTKAIGSLDRRTMLTAGSLALGAVALGGVAANSAQSQAGGKRKSIPSLGQRIPVAFLMDDHATMIDFAGPWEVFQDGGVGDRAGFYLYTVAKSLAPLQTTGNSNPSGMTGLRFTPDFTFGDAPQPRIIVMGAQAGRKDPAKLAWIREAAVGADVVMSVCTGAFILASSGLLDGLEATTHHNFFDSFEREFPKVKLARGRRFVDNGKFVTAGGLTSGIDAALHIVERFYGTEATQLVADYMEHYSPDWKTGAVARG